VGLHARESVISEPPSIDPGSQHAAVIAFIADHLGRTLVTSLLTAIEPTDTGYLHGYDLKLRAPDGTIENQQVFIDDSPHGSRRGVISVPIAGSSTPAAVWIYPGDPELPALREVVDPVSASLILKRLGAPATVRSITVVTYRPGRRAVVRVEAESARYYLKVVEPTKAASIAERHQQFRSSSLPVPRLLGWSSDGIIAMSELPGVDAQSCVARMQDPEGFLDQVEFMSTLLANVPAFNTARASLVDRLDWYIERVCLRLPGEAARVRDIGAMIARCCADGRSYGYTAVTIHGDLHLGQLFVDPEDTGQITGMLDIDTAGTGDPADDAAAFYAHLVALGETAFALDPAFAAACARLAAAWRSRWQRNRNAGFANRASAIAATHLLGHALRPLSNDSEAVSLRLLDRAQELVRDW
jgi:aminoglycoside phosphotransferase